jgi:predicted nuclease of predicted toxin-antitoxin system
MRLLLDANLSPRKIGEPLRRGGHDVRAIAAERELDGLGDPSVLELAAADGRILVTRNSRDFVPLLRQWAEAQQHHAGCILIWTLVHHQFGRIVTAIDGVFQQHPDPDEWRDLALAI